MAHQPLRRDSRGKSHVRFARGANPNVAPRAQRGAQPKSRRGVAPRDVAMPFSPPEDWHEPTLARTGYKIVVQPPGEGYRHVLTRSEVRERLADLPEGFLRDLEVVQMSRITRKKLSLPCYGMQWGPSLYLYPIDETLVEYFPVSPSPEVVNEARMYGGRWRDEGAGAWSLVWSERSIKDFYLNNILIHELGHLLDERNTTYADRERFAEWFATEFGYRGTGGAEARRPGRKIRRRHHAV